MKLTKKTSPCSATHYWVFNTTLLHLQLLFSILYMFQRYTRNNILHIVYLTHDAPYPLTKSTGVAIIMRTDSCLETLFLFFVSCGHSPASHHLSCGKERIICKFLINSPSYRRAIFPFFLSSLLGSC